MEGTCEACGKTVLFVKEARFDGFTKLGDVLRCTSCGHETEVEAEGDQAPAAAATAKVIPALFSEEDVPEPIRIDGQDEQVEMCRYCVNYIVNPFTQRCGLHDKEVAATDSCPDFTLNEASE